MNLNHPLVDELIHLAIKEDVGPGDYSSLSAIPKDKIGKAQLIIKGEGILCGIELSKKIFDVIDSNLSVDYFLKDGAKVKYGDIGFIIEGPVQSILKAERLVLNFMQRLSGIATYTNQLAQMIAHTSTQLLDTRKTTPGLRILEKYAVKTGGGHNHRMGLYDMIMLKDNHIDFAGGITKAIDAANKYILENNLSIPIEIETRNLEEVKTVVKHGGVQRIMLDNFAPEKIKEALSIINNKFETEASGGINEQTIVKYAETGVDFISVGALTHSYQSLDISLKEI